MLEVLDFREVTQPYLQLKINMWTVNNKKFNSLCKQIYILLLQIFKQQNTVGL